MTMKKVYVSLLKANMAAHNRHTTTFNNRVDTKPILNEKRFIGLLLLILSIGIGLMVSTGQTIQERDCTYLIVILPLALALIFSK